MGYFIMPSLLALLFFVVACEDFKQASRANHECEAKGGELLRGRVCVRKESIIAIGER